MATQKPSFRPATKADAATLAVLVDIAGEGMPSFMWSTLKVPGQSVLEFGRDRARRDTGSFSYKNAVIAETDARLPRPSSAIDSMTLTIFKAVSQRRRRSCSRSCVSRLRHRFVVRECARDQPRIPPPWHWLRAACRRRNQGARSGSACPQRHCRKLEWGRQTPVCQRRLLGACQ